MDRAMQNEIRQKLQMRRQALGVDATELDEFDKTITSQSAQFRNGALDDTLPLSESEESVYDECQRLSTLVQYTGDSEFKNDDVALSDLGVGGKEERTLRARLFSFANVFVAAAVARTPAGLVFAAFCNSFLTDVAYWNADAGPNGRVSVWGIPMLPTTATSFTLAITTLLGVWAIPLAGAIHKSSRGSLMTAANIAGALSTASFALLPSLDLFALAIIVASVAYEVSLVPVYSLLTTHVPARKQILCSAWALGLGNMAQIGVAGFFALLLHRSGNSESNVTNEVSITEFTALSKDSNAVISLHPCTKKGDSLCTIVGDTLHVSSADAVALLTQFHDVGPGEFRFSASSNVPGEVVFGSFDTVKHAFTRFESFEEETHYVKGTLSTDAVRVETDSFAVLTHLSSGQQVHWSNAVLRHSPSRQRASFVTAAGLLWLLIALPFLIGMETKTRESTESQYETQSVVSKMRTAWRVLRRRRPEGNWFLLMNVVLSAGDAGLGAALTPFLMTVAHMTSTEIALLLVGGQICGIAGGALSARFSKTCRPSTLVFAGTFLSFLDFAFVVVFGVTSGVAFGARIAHFRGG
ncbi:MAG: hypothetical protein MHM6MM_001877 [Cercozoa sp. M6MM]